MVSRDSMTLQTKATALDFLLGLSFDGTYLRKKRLEKTIAAIKLVTWMYFSRGSLFGNQQCRNRGVRCTTHLSKKVNSCESQELTSQRSQNCSQKETAAGHNDEEIDELLHMKAFSAGGLRLSMYSPPCWKPDCAYALDLKISECILGPYTLKIWDL